MVYQSFFGLAESPFNQTPDPRFFFFSRKHEEALSHILFGIQERRGFILITGEVGTGKTTLCRLLLQRMDRRVRTSLLFNANMGTVELLQAINQDFGLPGKGTTKKMLVDELNPFLLDGLARGENAVLMIDEAQNLSVEAMEEIRLLSNLETEREKLIQILLVGQPELREKLALHELRQLNQRITLRHEIFPLDLAETEEYIGLRLRVAGGTDQTFWTHGGFEAVHRFSGGIPRLINVAADRALLAAYVAESRIINEEIVMKGLMDLANASLDHSVARGGGAARSGPFRSRSSVRTAAGALAATVLLWGGWQLFSHPAQLGSLPPAQQDVASLQTFEAVAGPLAAAAPGQPLSAADSQMMPSPKPDAAFSPSKVSNELPSLQIPERPPELASALPPAAPQGFDARGVYRVGTPEETRAAAYLTLLKLWGRVPENPERVMNESDPVPQWLGSARLQQYTISLTPPRLARLKYPVLFRVAGDPAHYAVLSALVGERAELLDPLVGEIKMALGELRERWIGEGTVLWERLEGIEEPLPASGEPVRRLQKALAEEGLMASGEVDGILGPKTREAVLNYQLRAGLRPEGTFNAETHLMLARTLNGDRLPSLAGPITSPHP